MKQLFFPGCRVKSKYIEGSTKLADYLYQRYNLLPEGCCKENYTKIDLDTQVILICNNCAVELSKLTTLSNVTFVYELIDQDPEFIYPDYQGMTVYLQECHHGYNNKDISSTVHSLLTKMNINYQILPESVPSGLANKDHRAIVANQCENYQDHSFVSYCPICNLTLLNNNKTSYYLLDLLFKTI